MATTEKRSVTMNDGRVVQFGKVEKVSKEILKGNGGHPVGIRFDADNGDTFLAEFDDLPDAGWVAKAEPTGISLWAMAHGFSQKLGDSYASLDKSADCLEAARAIWSRICKGQWQSDTRGFAGSSILLEAILRAYKGETRESARVTLASMTATERAGLQVTEPIKSHFDAILRERATGDVSVLTAKFKQG